MRDRRKVIRTNLSCFLTAPELTKPTSDNSNSTALTTQQGITPPATTPSPRCGPPRNPMSPGLLLALPLSYRFTGRSKTPDNVSKLPITDGWLFKGLRKEIGDLSIADIIPIDEPVVARTNHVMAEYTWIETTQRLGGKGSSWPALYVPGDARIWRGIRQGARLLTPEHNKKRDRGGGVVVGDEHAQRQPLFPYEPTFRALEATASTKEDSTAITNFRTVEIIADADTLSTIFSFLLSADPRTTTPFRLELSTVRNTLFLSEAAHPRRGHTNTKAPRVASTTMPDWAAEIIAATGSKSDAATRLPYSGGHWRVVRYRLGKMACVVRSKVDFVQSNHRVPKMEVGEDPLRGATREMHLTTNGGVGTFKTTVREGGRGTTAGQAGVVTVRFPTASAERNMQRHMPLLYFGRVPFIMDTVVSSSANGGDTLRVRDAQMLSARDRFARWERQYQATLQRMVALLKKFKEITRALGGSCVVVADPSNRFFSVFRPFVADRLPVPEDVVTRFWPGDNDDDAMTEYESTVDSVLSELSRLSKTPSGFEGWTPDMTNFDEPEMEDGGEDDTVDEERERKRRRFLNPYLIMQPMINPRGRVSTWLNDGGDDAGCEPDVGGEEVSDDDSNPIRPGDSASRLNGGAGVGYGHDGAMEFDVEMADDEDDEEEEEEEGAFAAEDNFDNEDNLDIEDNAEADVAAVEFEDDSESGSDWGANVSDRELYDEGSDEWSSPRFERDDYLF